MKKLIEIERLRGVAILIVLISHLDGTFFPKLPRIFTSGWSGVDLFFVISGYVVTLSFLRLLPLPLAGATFLERLRSAGAGLGAFYKRRLARVFPLALTASLLPAACAFFYNQSGVFGSARVVAREALIIATMQYNYERVFGEATHFFYYWSLAVEEHFYLLLPLLLVLAGSAEKAIRYTVAGILVVAFGIRPLLDSGFEPGSYDLVKYYVVLSHNRFDTLFCGVFLGLLTHSGFSWRPDIRRRGLFAFTTLFVCVILAVVPGIVSFGVFHRVGFLVNSLLSSWLVFVAAQDLGLVLAIPGTRGILRYLGSRCYALYLWHMPALWFLVETWHRLGKGGYGGLPSWAGFLQYVFVLGCLVELSYRFIERPFIRWSRGSSKDVRLHDRLDGSGSSLVVEPAA